MPKDDPSKEHERELRLRRGLSSGQVTEREFREARSPARRRAKTRRRVVER